MDFQLELHVKNMELKEGLCFKNRLNGAHPSSHGRPTVLSKAEEGAIVQHILVLSKWRFPLHLFEVRKLFQLYLDKAGKSCPIFQNNLPGHDWLQGFLKRNSNQLGFS